MDFFGGLNPLLQTLLATSFTWGMTALGAAVVFTPGQLSQKLLDGMLGFAAGVMIAASYWSLLAPAIEMAGGWFPAVVGFMAGGIFLFLIDKALPHLHIGFPREEAEGVKTSWQRTTLLVLAITLHNIPEGMAIGVAFGAVSEGYNATLGGAVALALGIGIQNFPEGTAISMPLKREGLSRSKSFLYGQLSGMVEPLAGLLGAAFVMLMKPLLPYALAFAAGAMIFVVVEEVIPESHRGGNSDFATMGAMIGFTVMMFLDVALG